jgi:hypothetical protein
MNVSWRTIIWQQFGAAIDMLDNALRACPDSRWRDSLAIFETLTDEKANQRCEFPWGEEVSFTELQLYNMRHVQEHAAQLSLHLGQKGVSAPDWVARAEHKAA